MIACDTNLLLYAYNAVDPRHTLARNRLKAALTGNEQVGLAWPVISGFLRLSTNSRAFLQPFEMSEAVAIVTRWLKQPNLILLEPTNRHWSILSQLLLSGQVRGDKTTDAEIAALAMEHGAVLHTANRDFARFPGLRTFNPLAS